MSAPNKFLIADQGALKSAKSLLELDDENKLKQIKSLARSQKFRGDIKKIDDFEGGDSVIDVNALRSSGLRVIQMGIPFSIKSGVVSVVRNLTEMLSQDGQNVCVINHWWHKYHYYHKTGNDYIKKEVRMSPYSLINKDFKHVRSYWALKQLLNEIVKVYGYGPQVCHLHTHTFYEDKSIQIFKKRFSSVPIVFTLHAFIPYIRLGHEDRLRLLNDEMTPDQIRDARKNGYHGREKSQDGLIKMADHIITISDVHKEAFVRLYPEFKDKVTSIPNGTDMDEYKDLKEVHERADYLRRTLAPRDEKLIIYVGRIEAQKGCKKLAGAFNLIANSDPRAKLVMIGSGEDQIQKLIDLGLEQRFVSRVHFAGWVRQRQELAAYYKCADVMIQPVFSKNLYAMVALEAMIMKTPVISCPGHLTYESCDDAQDMFKAVMKIFNSDEGVQRHVETTHHEVMNNYSRGAQYNKHLEIYHKLL